jgi:hypothetical protein
MGPAQRVGLLRADSGFCDKAFLEHLEQGKSDYTVAMRLVRPLQHALVHARWWPLQELSEDGKTMKTMNPYMKIRFFRTFVADIMNRWRQDRKRPPVLHGKKAIAGIAPNTPLGGVRSRFAFLLV